VIDEILAIAATFCLDYGVTNCTKEFRLVPKERLVMVRSDPKHPEGRRAHGFYNSIKGLIEINKEHALGINKWELKELVYHEMAHAYFNLGHNNNISIMNPFNKESNYWVKSDGTNWNYLRDELGRIIKKGE